MEQAGGGPLKIAALIKQTPDVNAVKIDRATGEPTFTGQQVISSYDAHAVEEALRLRDQFGGEVIVVTAGPAAAKDALTRALAMGADRGIHIEVTNVNALDSFATARLRADQLRPLGCDLIVAGLAADDYETGQVGAQVAELLDLPLVSGAVSVEISDGALSARRDTEDGYQRVSVPLPAMLLSSTGLNEPRLPSLKGIMAAKKKPVEKIAAAPETETRLTWGAPAAPERTAGGVLVQDVSATEAAKQLAAWLREQKLI
ncbi:MAG: electron transfer flavoprotein subunit beta/FixA family protein [Thermomicrobiales bacterium]|nr:electron transfer flavoprotein subunit beta/FixA family protein [Thermomicrobiales bacterium]